MNTKVDLDECEYVVTVKRLIAATTSHFSSFRSTVKPCNNGFDGTKHSYPLHVFFFIRTTFFEPRLSVLKNIVVFSFRCS